MIAGFITFWLSGTVTWVRATEPGRRVQFSVGSFRRLKKQHFRPCLASCSA